MTNLSFEEELNYEALYKDLKNRLQILEGDVLTELIGRIEAIEKLLATGYLLDD